MIVPLDADQRLAADQVEGNTIIIAGPGAGKTTVLTNHYAEMISIHNIPMDQILNLTFTREGAKNMQERIGITGAKEVFRTFHSLALDIVQKEKQFLPFKAQDFILPNGQDYELKKRLLKMYPAVGKYRKLDDYLKSVKALNLQPQECIEQASPDEYFLAFAYRDYERICREEGWLDFSSLMDETVKLLETNNEVRERWVRKYICVDECQDTDSVQFRLLQLLYGGNIFVVGDENQCIYEWRSAVVGSLSNFSKIFPGGRTLYLGANYRSTGCIVDLLKRIIPVDNGLGSHMRSMRDRGEKPKVTKFDSDIDEASSVLSQITDVGNTAVIARINRQLRTVQKLALEKGIKTAIVGKKDLWQKDEVKHLMRLTTEQEDADAPAYDALKRAMDRNNLTRTYANTGTANEKPPIENLGDLIALAAKRGTVKEFASWLRRMSYACEAAKSSGYKGKSKDPVLALTTVHQAKGREWKHVFVIGAQQGMMPHKDGEFLEEKRIFFVACSRAADLLNISYYGRETEFLADVEDEVIRDRKDYYQDSVADDAHSLGTLAGLFHDVDSD